jgi:alkaline phosphatase D
MDGTKLRVPYRALLAPLLFFCGLGAGAGCSQAQDAPVVLTSEHGPNSAETLQKHYVILVSLDGFRYDYAEKYRAENLLALAKAGATAPEGMLPAYPSLTFPNHYTLATGLYPEHHGIVANSFYDPARKQIYSLGNPATVTDGSWYGGTPIWVLTELQGMRAACFFWPGSEAEIQGARPSYYLKYDDKFPNHARVEQVLAWLQLPPERRPHLITLYFSEVDHQGHEHGPDSPEVAAAVQLIDKEIGALEAGLKKLALPVDVIVVADHGMATVQGDWITLDDYLPKDLAFEKVVGSQLYAKSDADAERAYEALHGKSERFEVYRRAQLPAHLHDDSNPRAGDPVIVTTGPYLVRMSAPPPANAPGAAVSDHKQVGSHGFDPARMPEMKASFFAAGPDIRAGATVQPFDNVDIFPLVAKLLSLDVSRLQNPPLDGTLAPLQTILKAH